MLLRRDFDVINRLSFQRNINWFISIKIRKKFNMQITINLKEMQLILKIDIRILKLQIDTK